jgi:hypothetical protein
MREASVQNNSQASACRSRRSELASGLPRCRHIGWRGPDKTTFASCWGLYGPSGRGLNLLVGDTGLHMEWPCWLPTVDDQRRPCEKHARHSRRMLNEFLSCKYAVENEAGVRVCTRLDCVRRDGPSIRSVGCAQLWENWIVVRTISAPELMLVAHVAGWA